MRILVEGKYFNIKYPQQCEVYIRQMRYFKRINLFKSRYNILELAVRCVMFPYIRFSVLSICT